MWLNVPVDDLAQMDVRHSLAQMLCQSLRDDGLHLACMCAQPLVQRHVAVFKDNHEFLPSLIDPMCQTFDDVAVRGNFEKLADCQFTLLLYVRGALQQLPLDGDDLTGHTIESDVYRAKRSLANPASRLIFVQSAKARSRTVHSEGQSEMLHDRNQTWATQSSTIDVQGLAGLAGLMGLAWWWDRRALVSCNAHWSTLSTHPLPTHVQCHAPQTSHGHCQLSAKTCVGLPPSLAGCQCRLSRCRPTVKVPVKVPAACRARAVAHRGRTHQSPRKTRRRSFMCCRARTSAVMSTCRSFPLPTREVALQFGKRLHPQK